MKRICKKCGQPFSGFGLENECPRCRLSRPQACSEARKSGKCETQSCGQGCDTLAAFRQTWAEMEG